MLWVISIIVLALMITAWSIDWTAVRLLILDVITPFATMARELRRANELKELEMSERLNPSTGLPAPIIPITEKPGKHDTEVIFGVGDNEKQTLKDRLVAEFERDALEDEE